MSTRCQPAGASLRGLPASLRGLPAKSLRPAQARSPECRPFFANAASRSRSEAGAPLYQRSSKRRPPRTIVSVLRMQSMHPFSRGGSRGSLAGTSAAVRARAARLRRSTAVTLCRATNPPSLTRRMDVTVGAAAGWRSARARARARRRRGRWSSASRDSDAAGSPPVPGLQDRLAHSRSCPLA